MDANQVSQQAFQQQVSNWQLTLQREFKKLKQLRKLSKNKFQLNSIDITLIEIESELIQYKKIRDKKYASSVALIEDYTLLSKRFMAIMEKIGDAVEQDRFKETSPIQVEMENTNPNINANVSQNKTKHFLQQTFTHKVSKEPSRKKAKSTITTAKQLTELLRKDSKHCASIKQKSSLKISKTPTNLRGLELQEEEDLSDIRYQLKEIKSMMVQIDNEIKFHSHEEVQREISKLSHAGKKISSEMKALREDNQFILARLQNIKDEINHQKQIQAEMIKQFELGKESKALVSQLAKSKNTAEEVSEWVRVRI